MKVVVARIICLLTPWFAISEPYVPLECGTISQIEVHPSDKLDTKALANRQAAIKGFGRTYPLCDLGNNTEYWKARATYRNLRNKRLETDEWLKLEEYAGCDDYQARQLASLLLVKQHLKLGLELSSLSDQMKTNLVEALRDDDINPRHDCSLPSNGDIAWGLLQGNKLGRELVEMLYGEVTGNDVQSARYASKIFVKRLDESKLADERINVFLISDLRADRWCRGYFQTWRLIDELGKENLISIVSTGNEFTEFQSAVLQILCAKYDIDWSPLDSVIEEWKSITASNRKPEYFIENRIRQAALYLTPSITGNSNQASLPRRTRQLFLTEGRLVTAKASEKHEWVLSWFLSFPE